MDDDGLIQIDRNGPPQQLAFSASEPYFSKYKPFSLRHSVSATTYGSTQPQSQLNEPCSQSAGIQGTSSFESRERQTLRRNNRLFMRNGRTERSRETFDQTPLEVSTKKCRRYPSHYQNNIAACPIINPAKSEWNSLAEQEPHNEYLSAGIEFTSFVAETLLPHPCVVLRRQCQVSTSSAAYHLTPFSLLPVIYNLHKSQGASCLWKGVGTVFLVRGLRMLAVSCISEATGWPRQVTRHSGSRKVAQHVLLEAASWAAVAPFYAASLLATVESSAASDGGGLLRCLRDGAGRYLASPPLLAAHRLAAPVALVGVGWYAIRSLADCAVTRSALPRGGGCELSDRVHARLLAGFVGALLSETLLFPAEALLHRLCVQGTHALTDNIDSGIGVSAVASHSGGAAAALATALAAESPLGLYRGFGALLLQFGTHLCLLRAAKMACGRLLPAAGAPRRQQQQQQPDSCDSESTASYGSPFSDADELLLHD